MYFNSGDDSIVGDIRYWTGSNTTTYPIADIVRNSNRALDKIVGLIMKSDARWEWDDNNNTDLPIATFDIVSGQPDYSLSITHLKIARFRVKDQQGNWVTLEPRDRREMSDSELEAEGVPSTYDKLGASVFPMPIPNYGSTAGGEIQFQRAASYFTTGDTTKEPGFASTFHRMVSFLASLDYTEPNNLKERSATIRARLGREPGTNGPSDLGTGLYRDLVEFYSTRDNDKPPRMSIDREDYGADALAT